MQGLAKRIFFPRGFNRPYRDMTVYIDSYSMEELGNLAWIGGIVSHNTPPLFKRVCALLIQIMRHYIFGFLDDEVKMQRAARACLELARLVEDLVQRGKVCTHALCLQCRACMRTCAYAW